MLKIKNGVTPKNLVIAAACANVASAADRFAELDVVITAGTDGVHMKGSKHYIGDALDIRRSNIPDVPRFMDTVRGRLGSDYQVLLEKDHIHIEYDPPKARPARRKGDGDAIGRPRPT